jgi:hypothetical protein
VYIRDIRGRPSINPLLRFSPREAQHPLTKNQKFFAGKPQQKPSFRPAFPRKSAQARNTASKDGGP